MDGSGGSSVRRQVEPDKSANDKSRSYRALELSNGMRVLLVSDPGTDKSAAAMNVSVGYMNDPRELPGLAHFLEHMLFLGTEAYPDENEYSLYLKQHGGSSNAYTATHHTNFYFDVAPDHFSGALQRFAQFFLGPLFTESATEREINAVNSEHQKNVFSDPWRFNQIVSSAVCDPEHDFSKFGTGNLATLSEIPAKSGIDVRQHLLDFHRSWYSANIMCLVVLDKEPLDQLQADVVRLFTDVKDNGVEAPSWPGGTPFSEASAGSYIYYCPVKDSRSLDVRFPIEDFRKDYKANPASYVSHLIGHEGKGSLLSELKARKWANSLSSGEVYSPAGFSFFMVQVEVTKEGLDNVAAIVELIFQYVEMIRQNGLQEWIFEESKNIGEMSFRFKDKERPQSYVSMLSASMPYCALEDVLTAHNVVSEWRPDLVAKVVDSLTPQDARIFVTGKMFEELCTEEEKWFGSKYKVVKATEAEMERWRAPSAAATEVFHVPEKNPFIPVNFDLCQRVPEGTPGHPVIIYESPLTRLWFEQDQEFLLPKICMNVEILAPICYLDPFHSTLSILYSWLVKDEMNEGFYPAEIAGMQYGITGSKYGLVLHLGGYHDKFCVLLKDLVGKVTNFRKVDEKMFLTHKDAYFRKLRNFQKDQPHQLAMYHNNVLLVQRCWTNEELLDTEEYVTAEALNSFIPRLFGDVHLEVLISGNATPGTARTCASTVEEAFREAFGSKPLPRSYMCRDREHCLDKGTDVCQEVTVLAQKTTCLEVYYQCGVQTTRSNVLAEFYIQLINEKCFDVLRTKEQLGYIVFSGVRRSNGSQGIRVLIQSDRHPLYLDQRIEAFVESTRDFIVDMSEEDFEVNRKGLIAKRLEKPKRLAAKQAKHWAEICNRQLNFDRNLVETEELKTVSRADLLYFFDKYVSGQSVRRRKVSCRVMPEDASEVKALEQDNIPDGASKVEDVVQFKAGLRLNPLAKPFSDAKSFKWTFD